MACRERRNVAITLANTEAVIASLSALIGVACHLGAFFAYLAIFGVDVQQLVISLSSMTLALTFVFGHSLQVIYESVVFLFVVRPFQVCPPLLLLSRNVIVEHAEPYMQLYASRSAVCVKFCSSAHAHACVLRAAQPSKLIEQTVWLRCMQVGDTIVYQDAHHKVSSFGLLWTHLRHDNGTRMAVRCLAFASVAGVLHTYDPVLIACRAFVWCEADKTKTFLFRVAHENAWSACSKHL